MYHNVVLLSGLHIELSLLKLIGDWSDGSVWVSVKLQLKAELMLFRKAPTFGDVSGHTRLQQLPCSPCILEPILHTRKLQLQRIPSHSMSGVMKCKPLIPNLTTGTKF